MQLFFYILFTVCFLVAVVWSFVAVTYEWRSWGMKANLLTGFLASARRARLLRAFLMPYPICFGVYFLVGMLAMPFFWGQ